MNNIENSFQATTKAKYVIIFYVKIRKFNHNRSNGRKVILDLINFRLLKGQCCEAKIISHAIVSDATLSQTSYRAIFSRETGKSMSQVKVKIVSHFNCTNRNNNGLS